MKEIFIAPSILSSDFSNLENEIKDLDKEGASYLHFDVMDGHFVNNISFGSYVLKCISNKTSLIKDVHLMIYNPKKYVKDFIDAGADIITFHFEAIKENEIEDLINYIRSFNKKVGIAIKPNTDVSVLNPYLKSLDLVLIMSVEPGFGGQKFIDTALNKIEYLKTIKNKYNYKYMIEVDGGINDVTSKLCIEKGVDILVSGSFIFHSKNRKETIENMKGN